MFPKSACGWAPVALSKDLPPATVIPAFLPEGRFALWRSASGALSLCNDRCPHRGMRLSHGFVRGEALSCIYHGWSYAQSGACLKIPAHPELEPPAAIKVDTYSVTEADGVIWAAVQVQGAAPPRFEDWTPLRSMTFEAAPEDIAAASEGSLLPSGAVECVLAGTQVLLLATRLQTGQTLLHALTARALAPSAKIAVSRALEDLRRAAEPRASGKEAAA